MEKFLLEDFAGGAVAERIGSAIQRVYENIANPNMDTEKARKLTIELTFKAGQERQDGCGRNSHR